MRSIVRKHGVEGIGKVVFSPESDNKYDPNAMKIIFENIGHIGYVPGDIAIDIASIINTKSYEAKWNIKIFVNDKNEEVGYMEIRLYLK